MADRIPAAVLVVPTPSAQEAKAPAMRRVIAMAPTSLPAPFKPVSHFPKDRGELVSFFRACVDQLPHPSDLRLLYGHHDEQSNDDHDEKNGPDPEAKPMSATLFDHGDASRSGPGQRLNVTGFPSQICLESAVTVGLPAY